MRIDQPSVVHEFILTAQVKAECMLKADLERLLDGAKSLVSEAAYDAQQDPGEVPALKFAEAWRDFVEALLAMARL